MSVPAAVRVGTLLDRPNKRVYRADEFGELADAALVDEHYELGSQRVVWADDLTRPRPRGWSPETVLVITVNRGWGAAYFRSANHAWITHNPQPAAGTPELIFDDQVDANFPPEAAVPVDRLHEAIEEYLLTGQQPSGVQWRPAERYMTW